MERKDFLRQTISRCRLALVPAGVTESCKKQSFAGPTNVNFTIDLTNSANAVLNTQGGASVAKGIIVIRVNSGTYVAFCATCSHAGCTVGYNSGSVLIVCPCHGGTFSAGSGAVISGPPPSSLN